MARYKKLKSIRDYMFDKGEMIEQIFSSIPIVEIKNMVPMKLQGMPLHELKAECLMELLGMSDREITNVLDGRKNVELPSSESEPEEVFVISDEEKRFDGRKRKMKSERRTPVQAINVDSESSSNERSSSSKKKKRKSKEVELGNTKKKKVDNIPIPIPSCSKDWPPGKVPPKKKKNSKPSKERSKTNEEDVVVLDEISSEEEDVKGEKKSLLDLLELEMRARAIRSLLKKEEQVQAQKVLSEYKDEPDDLIAVEVVPPQIELSDSDDDYNTKGPEPEVPQNTNGTIQMQLEGDSLSMKDVEVLDTLLGIENRESTAKSSDLIGTIEIDDASVEQIEKNNSSDYVDCESNVRDSSGVPHDIDKDVEAMVAVSTLRQEITQSNAEDSATVVYIKVEDESSSSIRLSSQHGKKDIIVKNATLTSSFHDSPGKQIETSGTSRTLNDQSNETKPQSSACTDSEVVTSKNSVASNAPGIVIGEANKSVSGRTGPAPALHEDKSSKMAEAEGNVGQPTSGCVVADIGSGNRALFTVSAKQLVLRDNEVKNLHNTSIEADVGPGCVELQPSGSYTGNQGSDGNKVISKGISSAHYQSTTPEISGNSTKNSENITRGESREEHASVAPSIVGNDSGTEATKVVQKAFEPSKNEGVAKDSDCMTDRYSVNQHGLSKEESGEYHTHFEEEVLDYDYYPTSSCLDMKSSSSDNNSIISRFRSSPDHIADDYVQTNEDDSDDNASSRVNLDTSITANAVVSKCFEALEVQKSDPMGEVETSTLVEEIVPLGIKCAAEELVVCSPSAEIKTAFLSDRGSKDLMDSENFPRSTPSEVLDRTPTSVMVEAQNDELRDDRPEERSVGGDSSAALVESDPSCRSYGIPVAECSGSKSEEINQEQETAEANSACIIDKNCPIGELESDKIYIISKNSDSSLSSSEAVSQQYETPETNISEHNPHELEPRPKGDFLDDKVPENRIKDEKECSIGEYEYDGGCSESTSEKVSQKPASPQTKILEEARNESDDDVREGYLSESIGELKNVHNSDSSRSRTEGYSGSTLETVREKLESPETELLEQERNESHPEHKPIFLDDEGPENRISKPIRELENDRNSDNSPIPADVYSGSTLEKVTEKLASPETEILEQERNESHPEHNPIFLDDDGPENRISKPIRELENDRNSDKPEIPTDIYSRSTPEEIRKKTATPEKEMLEQAKNESEQEPEQICLGDNNVEECLSKPVVDVENDRSSDDTTIPMEGYIGSTSEKVADPEHELIISDDDALDERISEPIGEIDKDRNYGNCENSTEGSSGSSSKKICKNLTSEMKILESLLEPIESVLESKQFFLGYDDPKACNSDVVCPIGELKNYRSSDSSPVFTKGCSGSINEEIRRKPVIPISKELNETDPKSQENFLGNDAPEDCIRHKDRPNDRLATVQSCVNSKILVKGCSEFISQVAPETEISNQEQSGSEPESKQVFLGDAEKIDVRDEVLPNGNISIDHSFNNCMKPIESSGSVYEDYSKKSQPDSIGEIHSFNVIFEGTSALNCNSSKPTILIKDRQDSAFEGKQLFTDAPVDNRLIVSSDQELSSDGIVDHEDHNEKNHKNHPSHNTFEADGKENNFSPLDVEPVFLGDETAQDHFIVEQSPDNARSNSNECLILVVSSEEDVSSSEEHVSCSGHQCDLPGQVDGILSSVEDCSGAPIVTNCTPVIEPRNQRSLENVGINYFCAQDSTRDKVLSQEVNISNSQCTVNEEVYNIESSDEEASSPQLAVVSSETTFDSHKHIECPSILETRKRPQFDNEISPVAFLNQTLTTNTNKDESSRTDPVVILIEEEVTNEFSKFHQEEIGADDAKKDSCYVIQDAPKASDSFGQSVIDIHCPEPTNYTSSARAVATDTENEEGLARNTGVAAGIISDQQIDRAAPMTSTVKTGGDFVIINISDGEDEKEVEPRANSNRNIDQAEGGVSSRKICDEIRKSSSASSSQGCEEIVDIFNISGYNTANSELRVENEGTEQPGGVIVDVDSSDSEKDSTDEAEEGEIVDDIVEISEDEGDLGIECSVGSSLKNVADESSVTAIEEEPKSGIAVDSAVELVDKSQKTVHSKKKSKKKRKKRNKSLGHDKKSSEGKTEEIITADKLIEVNLTESDTIIIEDDEEENVQDLSKQMPPEILQLDDNDEVKTNWTSRWLESNNVKDVVRTSKIFMNARKKMKIKWKTKEVPLLDASQPPMEMPPLIGSIEEYNRLVRGGAITSSSVSDSANTLGKKSQALSETLEIKTNEGNNAETSDASVVSRAAVEPLGVSGKEMSCQTIEITSNNSANASVDRFEMGLVSKLGNESGREMSCQTNENPSNHPDIAPVDHREMDLASKLRSESITPSTPAVTQQLELQLSQISNISLPNENVSDELEEGEIVDEIVESEVSKVVDRKTKRVTNPLDSSSQSFYRAMKPKQVIGGVVMNSRIRKQANPLHRFKRKVKKCGASRRKRSGLGLNRSTTSTQTGSQSSLCEINSTVRTGSCHRSESNNLRTSSQLTTSQSFCTSTSQTVQTSIVQCAVSTGSVGATCATDCSIPSVPLPSSTAGNISASLESNVLASSQSAVHSYPAGFNPLSGLTTASSSQPCTVPQGSQIPPSMVNSAFPNAMNPIQAASAEISSVHPYGAASGGLTHPQMSVNLNSTVHMFDPYYSWVYGQGLKGSLSSNYGYGTADSLPQDHGSIYKQWEEYYRRMMEACQVSAASAGASSIFGAEPASIASPANEKGGYTWVFEHPGPSAVPQSINSVSADNNFLVTKTESAVSTMTTKDQSDKWRYRFGLTGLLNEHFIPSQPPKKQ